MIRIHATETSRFTSLTILLVTQFCVSAGKLDSFNACVVGRKGDLTYFEEHLYGVHDVTVATASFGLGFRIPEGKKKKRKSIRA